MSILRQTAPDTARRIAGDLRTLGVPIPQDVREHLDNLDRLDGERPAQRSTADLEAAYMDGKSAEEVQAIAAELATHPARLNAWTEARIKVAHRAMAAFIGNGDDLTAALAKLAAPLIEKLADVAAIDTLDTTALIRAGRTSEAEAAARAGIVAGDLEHLYRLRDRITKGAEYGIDRIDCRRWMDPRKVPSGQTVDALEGFLRGIKADARLWFPLPHEAQAQAAPLAAEAKAEADALRAKTRGGVVAFG